MLEVQYRNLGNDRRRFSAEGEATRSGMGFKIPIRLSQNVAVPRIQEASAAQMNMQVPKVQTVSPSEDHILVVLFSDGTKKSYDVGPLTDNEMFAPLKNRAFFRNVSVEPGGYAVSWNSDIDISDYELWQHGKTMP